jgi:hypothetical protein
LPIRLDVVFSILLERVPLATTVRFRDRLGLSDPRKRARL